MAPTKEAVSFDAIIQAGREQREKQKLADDLLGQGRREKQRLADQILGNGRTAKVQGNGGRASGVGGGSLASRVGIAKPSQRSTSNTPKPKPDVETTWGHDLHKPKGPRSSRPARDNPLARQVKNDILFDTAVNQSPQNGTAPRRPGEEISIRGTAGPYVVVASNFAPGTTAADIESAMIPSGGEMQSCRILTSSPTVIAEMVFTEKHNADTVISTFNNKKADGRILHVYLKTGGPSAGLDAPTVRKTPTGPKQPRSDLPRNEPSTTYDSQREQADRRRRAEPEVQDGSYGFAAKDDEMDVDTEVLGAEKPATDNSRSEAVRPTDDRRDNRDRDRDRRYDRYNARYDAPRGGGRGRPYFNRDRDEGRPRNGYRLHSDDLYPRPRGRGFR